MAKFVGFIQVSANTPTTKAESLSHTFVFYFYCIQQHIRAILKLQGEKREEQNLEIKVANLREKRGKFVRKKVENLLDSNGKLVI